MKISCLHCSKKFERHDPRAKYCSRPCQTRAKKVRADAKRNPKRRYEKEDNEVIDPVARVVFTDFYDLVRKRPELVKRKCLRCKKDFKSQANARLCGSCKRLNNASSKLTGEVYGT